MFLCRMSFNSGNNLKNCVAMPAAITKSDDTQCPKLVLGFSSRSPCKILKNLVGVKYFQYP